MRLRDYDILVVGAGAAGTAAALSAAETANSLGKHVRIAIIERANEDGWGGNSRWTTAFFRMKDEDHLDPTLIEDLINDSQGKFNKDYALKLAKEAIDTIRWVRSKGVSFEDRSGRHTTVSKVNIAPVGGGLAIIAALRKHAENLGASMLLETTAYKLSLDSDGVVDGIWVRNHEGKSRRLSCYAVILAGGGFEGNYEMLTKYIGREAASLRMEVPGTPLHMGECINMALEVGAATSGEFGNYHGMVVDTRSNDFLPSVFAYIYGILVNINGKRFTDEGVAVITDSFETIGRSIFEQPAHKAYLILDQKRHSVENIEKDIYTKVPPIEAENLEELARLINISSSELTKTVEEFNKAVQLGEFNPTKMDGKHSLGINPPKSNWALTIDTPPYLCYPVEGTIEFTMGGIASDTRARALATNGSPIPALYVAGEMVGLNYHHLTGGTSVMRALVFGRIAGFEAARLVVNEDT